LAGFGCINLVLLAGIRYLGICKNYMTTKAMAIKILAASSITSMILVIIITLVSDRNPNQGYLFCSINFKSNTVANTISLLISLLLVLFLIAYSICYFNIGKVYYRNIMLLEESVLELNSLETGRQSRITDNSNYLESNILRNNPSLENLYNLKFQVIKLISILKIFSMIIFPFIEILPIGTFLILNHFVEIYRNELIENICYWIAEFSPLTNSLMILFLHRETCEEFYNFIIRK
jgi:hypothetical protein